MAIELPLDPYGMGSIFHILFEYANKTDPNPEVLKVARLDALCYFMSRHDNTLKRGGEHDHFLTAFRGQKASWGSLFNASYGMIAKNDKGEIEGMSPHRGGAAGDLAPYVRLDGGGYRLTKPGRDRAAVVAAKLKYYGYV